jgi:dTDP-4-amino-4,6-dideoxygalactose transaminase/nucleoside-diphosphate-sugar epimerase
VVVRGDIRRLQEHTGLFEGIDAVIHLAGLTNDPTCHLNPDMAADVNVESTRELARQAAQHSVKRFVFASACSVYGKGVFDSLDEDSPPNPVSTLAVTKLDAERAVLHMDSAFFEPVVARLASVFGRSPRMRFDLAVNFMVASAARLSRISVGGGGTQWRPFVHVRDVADALAAMVEARAGDVKGRIFNVGSDANNFTVGELAEKVAGLFPGITVDVLKGDEEVRSFRVQFDKVERVLQWKCKRSIEDAVAEVRQLLDGTDVDPFGEAYSNVRRMRRLLATPVDEGGEPTAARLIPLARPTLGPEEEEAVVEALRSGWLTSGPHLQTFEKALGEVVSSPHVVAVSSCTAALHLCLVRLGISPGDEVITSPLTWASTANTIVNMGARVVFADICPDTLNIDPTAIEGAFTDRTKAIMPVHLVGQPCDLDAIYAIANARGVPVVEDAAHALGASYKGVPIGAYGDYTCFSFYAIKNITTMEGGAVTLKDPEAAEFMRLLAGHGMTSTAWERYGRSAAAAPAQVVAPGYKYLMSNVSAAMGIEQLKKFAKFQAARQRLARMYASVLAGIDEVSLPNVIDGVEHAWHLMTVRLKLDKLAKTRDEIAHALRRENIATSVHFFGLHLNPYYRDTLGIRPDDLPHATAASHEILSLPLHPSMTDKNVHDVVEALKKVINSARR